MQSCPRQREKKGIRSSRSVLAPRRGVSSVDARVREEWRLCKCREIVHGVNQA